MKATAMILPAILLLAGCATRPADPDPRDVVVAFRDEPRGFTFDFRMVRNLAERRFDIVIRMTNTGDVPTSFPIPHYESMSVVDHPICEVRVTSGKREFRGGDVIRSLVKDRDAGSRIEPGGSVVG